MIATVAIVSALALQARFGPPERILPLSEPATAVQAFKRVCVDPFPDPAAFGRAVATDPVRFSRWQPHPEIERLVPTQIWHARDFTLQYVANNLLVDRFPDPQCSLTGDAAAGTVAETIFPIVASHLGLGSPRIVGRRRYRSAMWDLSRGDQRWRVIAGTEDKGDRVEYRLSMLNLRPEHR